ncbi:hypothetical protein C5167_048284 [Papaver somniferum]|uniref:Thionin-like protein 2 n=1 Tax=Papaver somniferum TaxID=3469 RepID=A0A4Y7KLQ1_PAPSO|nr:hypothetical protein C5167_048284 [Papaver somniferum]
MEGKNMRTISLLVIVMLGMFVGKSSAFSKECYMGCLLQCALTHPDKGIFACPFTCLKRCISKGIPLNEINSDNQFCKLGCATSKCLKKSTPQDPRGEEVERCVNFYCDNKCTN